MSLHLYDTASQTVVEFQPRPTQPVGIYSCGITPYDAAHLGHAAVYIAFDVLRRRLHVLGHETRLVRNVTDVDDDILKKARELGVFYLDLAAEQMALFEKDMSILGLLSATVEPRATSGISEILTLVGAALESGHAYESGGSVYFSVSSWKKFGHLSHLDKEAMLVLANENGGNPNDPHKRDPLDFVLWQPSLVDEPSWESRWGSGRPGWHIECSALSMRELGETVDIHGGGRDLVFPHHECEIAQSEAVTNKTFVRHWMHVGLVGLGGAKMSKSLGNLIFVRDLVKDYEPMAVRLALLAHHYRTDWEWRDDDAPEGKARLECWRKSGGDQAHPAATRVVSEHLCAEVGTALDDDLDTPWAIEVIDAAAARGHNVAEAALLLGVAL